MIPIPIPVKIWMIPESTSIPESESCITDTDRQTESGAYEPAVQNAQAGSKNEHSLKLLYIKMADYT